MIEYGLESISISYHFGLHDKISLIPSNILEEVFEILRRKNFNYRLMTTVTTTNYNMVSEMCRKTIELGARGIYFTNFILQGTALNLSDKGLVLNEEQIKMFFEQIGCCREKYDINKLLIERDAGFGKNIISTHDNFRCLSISEQVVLTPDNNIYPCIFLAKEGYEIGKYIDGKIMLYDEFYGINDGNTCYAKAICNEGKKLLKR